MARSSNLDDLSLRGTEKVLLLLVHRNARRIEDDVVGSLKQGAAVLDELHSFAATLAESYWQSTDLADQGIGYRVAEVEPGQHVDRVGVAVYATPAGSKRIPRDTLKTIAKGLANGVWFVRLRTYELAAEKDFFQDRADLPDDLGPWPGDGESLDAATVALVRASRRNEVFLHSSRGTVSPVDVGQVQPLPPTRLRTIVVDGLVNGHRWSSSEAHLLGTELGDARKSSLAGTKRSFSVKVPSATAMQAVLKISAERQRRRWTLDQYEYIVDGGRKKIEYRLVDSSEQAKPDLGIG